MCKFTCESIWACIYFPIVIFWKQFHSYSENNLLQAHWKPKPRTILEKEIGKFFEKKFSLGNMELFHIQTENLTDLKKSSKHIRTCHLDFPEENLSTPIGNQKIKKIPPSFVERKIVIRMLMLQTPWQVYKKTIVQIPMEHRWVVYTQTSGFKCFREMLSKSTHGV